MNFSGSKTNVAEFVTDMLMTSGRDSPSITITVRGSSEVYCVSIVIDISWEDTVLTKALSYSLQPIDIYTKNIWDGKFLQG